MNKGWIKLHRQFLDWEWYDEPNCTRVFLHCLLKANHKEKKYRGTLVKRGTFITSLDILAYELQLSKQSLRTVLRKLQSTGEINRLSNTHGTIITVCNYDTYQGDDEETNTPGNTRLTHEQHTTNIQLTTTKNEKNEKNENNAISVYPTQDEVVNYFIKNGKINEQDIALEAENFVNYYEATNWMHAGNKITNWKYRAGTWANKYIEFKNKENKKMQRPF